MAEIIRVRSDENGAVGDVQLLVGYCEGTKTVLGRTLHKIVLLV